MRTGHPLVDEVAQMSFEGIKIDHRWLGHPLLCHEDGKKVSEGKSLGFNLIAAYVLAEIVYFYSPSITRDAEGHVTSVKKRFDGEIMYQDYDVWSAKIGLTKRQLQDACAFLKRKGLIKLWAEPVTLRTGVRTNNMPHIEPVPEMIRELTYDGDGRGLTKKRDTPPHNCKPSDKAPGVSRSSARGLTKKRDTSTVRTTSSTGSGTKQQQQDAAASEPSAVVVAPDSIESQNNANGQLSTPATTPQINPRPDLVAAVLALKTGLSRDVIQKAVDLHPDYVEQVFLKEWPQDKASQPEYWEEYRARGGPGDMGGAARRRLLDPEWAWPRLAAEERKAQRIQAAREKRQEEEARLAAEKREKQQAEFERKQMARVTLRRYGDLPAKQRRAVLSILKSRPDNAFWIDFLLREAPDREIEKIALEKVDPDSPMYCNMAEAVYYAMQELDRQRLPGLDQRAAGEFNDEEDLEEPAITDQIKPDLEICAEAVLDDLKAGVVGLSELDDHSRQPGTYWQQYWPALGNEDCAAVAEQVKEQWEHR
jgi:hypothetical protein